MYTCFNNSIVVSIRLRYFFAMSRSFSSGLFFSAGYTFMNNAVGRRVFLRSQVCKIGHMLCRSMNPQP